MIPPLQQVLKLPRQYGELFPAAVFLAAWVYPPSVGFLGGNMGDALSNCMWLEFILGHAATAFVVVAYVTRTRTSRISSTVGFGLIYGVLVVVMCFAIGSFYPLIQFGIVLFGRLRLAAAGSRDDFKITQIILPASRIFLFMITAGLAAALPLPRLGATPEALPISGEGILVDNPHRTMAWGIMYFVAGWYLYNKLLPGAVPRITATIRGRLRLP
jgi:hypothetical protein